MVHEKLISALQRLEMLLPASERTDVNERTVFVWRRCSVDNASVLEVALERGWSAPAVEWHLRRAQRALQSE